MCEGPQYSKQYSNERWGTPALTGRASQPVTFSLFKRCLYFFLFRFVLFFESQHVAWQLGTCSPWGSGILFVSFFCCRSLQDLWRFFSFAGAWKWVWMCGIGKTCRDSLAGQVFVYKGMRELLWQREPHPHPLFTPNCLTYPYLKEKKRKINSFIIVSRCVCTSAICNNKFINLFYWKKEKKPPVSSVSTWRLTPPPHPTPVPVPV